MPAAVPPGRSIVTRRAIVDIVRAAVLGNYGVTRFGEPSRIDRLARALRLGEPGIRIRMTPRLEIELWLAVASGLPISEVANQVDAGVRHALRRSIGREPDALAIHVTNLRLGFDRTAPPRRVAGQPATAVGSGPRAGSATATRAPATNAVVVSEAPLPAPAVAIGARGGCGGEGLLAAYRAAVENLEAHVDEINTLNVYPVPDGDTGSNMAATVRAALEEAEAVDADTAARVAGAISFGSLMGARGNSGVITSQILRGMAEGLDGKRRFNGLDLAHALRLGSEAAYKAVVKPVEGTILTVIREASDAAVAAAERSNDIESVLAAAASAAAAAVKQTPALLPILHEAGVVDAGGQGLYRLFEGALAEVVSANAASPDRSRAVPTRASTLVAHADDGFGYETMFLVQPEPGGHLDLDAIRVSLESMGESVLVAGDQRAAKVHVHSEHPDEILGLGRRLGSLSRISVENLDAQAQGVREERAAAFTSLADPRGDGSSGNGASPDLATRTARDPGVSSAASAASAASTAAATTVPLAVIAVAAGDGLAAVFESFGCGAVVRGGQGANPSTGELLEAVEAANAEDVLLLPNNRNVLLAAQQVATLSRTRVAVVPTRNAAEGLAALLSLDPKASAADNARTMTEAGHAIQTLQVTEAVRDAKIDGRKVRRGQIIVLDPDEGLLAADADSTRAVLAAIDALTPGFELITIYYGEGADLAAAEGLSQAIVEHRPGVDVEIVHGGQPHYRYLIAAE